MIEPRSDPTTYRVAIADDSWHYARALQATLELEEDIDVVATVYSAEALLELAVDELHVVLVDLNLPEMGGVELCRRLESEHPAVAVVIVTAVVSRELARQCLTHGASAYVVKHDHHDPIRIAGAVRSAARGDLFFDRDLQTLLSELAAQGFDPAREAGLTPRELEVLPLIAEGLQNKEVARQLHVSEQTVRNHLSNIYRKLGSKNRTQMATEARRRGILS